MTQSPSAEAATKPWASQRRDNWWVEPALVGLGFALFIVYATYRAFQGHFYEVDSYISPFYSPKIPFRMELFGWPISPAIFILWIPAGFRATCYYYRKAYYRAYFADPPACSVGHFGGHKYTGETSFPLIFQNVHRFMLYFALLVLCFLWYDAINSFFLNGTFRVGIGSLIYLGNVLLLSNYTLGCHVFRHLVGGRLDCFTCPNGKEKTSYGAWKFVTKLNEHHMFWAWLSLFSVGIADAYTAFLVQNPSFHDTIIGPVLPFQHVL